MFLLLGLPRMWIFAISVGAGSRFFKQVRVNQQAQQRAQQAVEEAVHARTRVLQARTRVLQAHTRAMTVAAHELRLATSPRVGWPIAASALHGWYR